MFDVKIRERFDGIAITIRVNDKEELCTLLGGLSDDVDVEYVKNVGECLTFDDFLNERSKDMM